MASIGKTVNVNENGEGQAEVAGTGTALTSNMSNTNHQLQRTMTPDSTAGDLNVTSTGSPMGHAGNFMFNTNARFNMGYPHQQNPYGVANNIMRLNSLSSTGYDGNSYGYGTGVVPASPPNYPHSVQAMMANNGVQQPSPMDLNGHSATPQHPQQQYSSSQHGQHLIGMVNHANADSQQAATPGQMEQNNEMADDEYEYYEDNGIDEADDQLEELFQEEDEDDEEYDAMYAENQRNQTPGDALQQQQPEVEEDENEYYDEDDYYEDEPYGGM